MRQVGRSCEDHLVEATNLHQDPSNPAQWLLDRAAQVFNSLGTWPLFTDLKRELARQGGRLPIDALVEIQDLGLTEVGLKDADEVVLNVAGLAKTSPGRALLESYRLVIDLCVERYLGDGPLQIGEADLLARAYSPNLAQRLDALISREVYLFTGRSEPEGQGWTYRISSRIEEFRVVTNLDELLATRAPFVRAPVSLNVDRMPIAGIDTPDFAIQPVDEMPVQDEPVAGSATNPLLREPSPAQATLLDVIFQAYQEHRQWPIFQWVEKQLYDEHRLDARTVLAGCPRLTIQPAGIGQYGWIASTNPQPMNQLPGDTLSLSVSGLRNLPQARLEVAAFIAVLAYLVQCERRSNPTPTIVAVSTVSSKEVADHLVGLGWSSEPQLLRLIGGILGSEPSTWNCATQVEEDDTWTAKPDSFLRRYDGVETSQDYVNRLVDQIDPTSKSTTSSPISTTRSTGATTGKDYDYFLSYASEDRRSIAHPLYDALTAQGISVWFDQMVLEVGQSLTRSIDRGLATCKFGVVILSHSFFDKKWPIYELSGLVQRMNMENGQGVILPIWHDVTHEDVANFSPSLSDIVALNSNLGADMVAENLAMRFRSRST
jgi:hypothetical protein